VLTGLLWFDNDPHRSLVAKVEAAAQRYREKYGALPNACYVNQASLNGQEMTVPFEGRMLRIIPAPNILTNHFWVGKDEAMAK